MSSQWMPLPFLVFGFTQLVVGPSLLAGRLVAVLLGLAVVWLVFVIASRWGGLVAGAVAAGLFCTDGLVIGYFATVRFSSLAALVHLPGVSVLFCPDWRWRALAALASFSVVSLLQ